MNSLVVNKAFFFNSLSKKLLVFQNFYGILKIGDVLTDGHTEYKVIGLMPNSLSNALSVEVECKNFNPEKLIGAELKY